MARLEIRPFSAEFVASAGDLLAERHRAHRTAEPLLSERYEDAAASAAEVEALGSSDGASGSVALRGGRVVGYLLGIRKDDEIWGANVWVESAGHAVAEAEDLRDLYAAASERWFEEGRLRQYAMVPATDASLVAAWWRTGFGQQHALGIREVPDVGWPGDVVRAFRARPAGGRGTPGLGGHAAGRARLRRRHRAHGRGLRVGGRAGIRDDHDGLARDEPSLLPLLAQARFPGDLSPALPPHSLMSDATI